MAATVDHRCRYRRVLLKLYGEALEGAQFLFEFFLPREHRLEPFEGILVASAEPVTQGGEDLFATANGVEGSLPGQCLDPTHTGRDTGLGGEPEETDITGAPDVRAAAEFGREIPHADDADAIAVLVAEESERAGADGVVVGHLFGRDVGVFADAGVDLLFDGEKIAFGERALVAEVETQPAGLD